MGMEERSTYWLECDGDGCRERTEPVEDEYDASDEAERLGWFRTDDGDWLCKQCAAKLPPASRPFADEDYDLLRARYGLSIEEMTILQGEDEAAVVRLIASRDCLRFVLEDLARARLGRLGTVVA